MPDSSKSIRVMVADDQTMFLEIYTMILERRYEVVGAVKDGEALVAEAPALDPDVVLIDVVMPTMDGIEAARRLKQILPAAKLVFLTGHGDPDYLCDALEAGASGYLLKQSPSEELYHAIDEAVEGRIYVTPAIEDVAVQQFGARLSEVLRCAGELDQTSAAESSGGRRTRLMELLASRRRRH